MEDNGELTIHKTIGNFGKWQASVSILVSLLKIPIAWFQLCIVFLAPVTQFWCQIPTVKTEEYNDMSALQWRNFTMNDCQLQCEKYEYNRSVFYNTIVTEWDLVCEKDQMSNIAQMSFMFGVLIGNIVFGVASDKFGRKIPLMIAICLQTILSLGLSFVPWFYLFLLIRFFLAIAVGGTMITSFVMCMEVVGGKWRTSIPILYQIPFGLANSLMAVMAYFLRDWRQLTMTMSIISGFFLSYYWLLTESPRWLLAVGRKKEAVTILEKAAKINKIRHSDLNKILEQNNENQTEKKAKARFFSLFKTPNLRRATLSLFFNWFVGGLSVFGFMQYISQMGQSDDIFFNFTLGGLITLPGTLICVYVVQKFGRRSTILFSGIIFGFTCICVSVVPHGVFPHDWPKIVLAATSVTAISVFFPALYLYSGELFPTVARNGGLGGASMFARLGSMVAPFVLSTNVWADWAPLAIIGGLPLLAVVLIIPLPETKGCSLPDSLEDGENFGQKRTEEADSTEKGSYSHISD